MSKVLAEGTEETKRLAATVVPDLLLSKKLPLCTAISLGTEALRFTGSDDVGNRIYAPLVGRVYRLAASGKDASGVIDAGIALLESEGYFVASDPFLKERVYSSLLLAAENLVSQPNSDPLLTLRQGLKGDLAFLERVDEMLLGCLFEISEKSPLQAFSLAYDIWKDSRTTPDNRAACETFFENAPPANYTEGSHSRKLSMIVDVASAIGKHDERKQQQAIGAVTEALVHVEADGIPAVFRSLQEGGDESLDQKVGRAFNFLAEAFRDVPYAPLVIEQSLCAVFLELRTVKPHKAVRAGQSLFDQSQKRASRLDPDFIRIMQRGALTAGVVRGTIQLQQTSGYYPLDVTDNMLWLCSGMEGKRKNTDLLREAFQSIAREIPPQMLVHFLRCSSSRQSRTLVTGELDRRLGKGGPDAIEVLDAITDSPFSTASLMRSVLGRSKAERTSRIQALCG